MISDVLLPCNLFCLYRIEQSKSFYPFGCNHPQLEKWVELAQMVENDPKVKEILNNEEKQAISVLLQDVEKIGKRARLLPYDRSTKDLHAFTREFQPLYHKYKELRKQRNPSMWQKTGLGALLPTSWFNRENVDDEKGAMPHYTYDLERKFLRGWINVYNKYQKIFMQYQKGVSLNKCKIERDYKQSLEEEQSEAIGKLNEKFFSQVKDIIEKNYSKGKYQCHFYNFAIDHDHKSV